jgi:hypothetical protein
MAYSNQPTLFSFDKEELEEKAIQSQTIITDMRVSPFFPVDRICKNSALWKEFSNKNETDENSLRRKTPWGTIEIRNRLLTQKHLDLLNAVRANATKVKRLNDGRLVYYFSFYRVAQDIGLTWGAKTKEELTTRLKFIDDCTIYRKDEMGNERKYKMIEDVAYSVNEDSWGIILSKEYSSFFGESITIDNSQNFKIIRNITGEKSGLIKSIITHILSHSIPGKVGLEKILKTVGYSMSKRNIYEAKIAILKNEETFKKFNITYIEEKSYFDYETVRIEHFSKPLKKLEINQNSQNS